ncbi:uncharacterized protein F5Z01DRAFT_699611 [Emericellopsis atlantica]|uniref:Uncharacterized protein n=1 Tax=Emericellopsis atlantica TaxID=2614577 RepID=A0A9P8CR44_9HYPO|nr:uncharacterized protein F5Z01DRAFT_699611 [Emericellopsis atlantica]KAG9255795.1 hypothetical protein F5Z01DRAFT_699611 [Emericellopsis atlantica]
MADLASNLSAAAAQMRYDLGRYRQEELPLDKSSRGGNNYSDLVHNRKPPKIAQGWGGMSSEALLTSAVANGFDQSQLMMPRRTKHVDLPMETLVGRTLQKLLRTTCSSSSFSTKYADTRSKIATSSPRPPVHTASVTPQQLNPNNPLRTIVYSGKCIISGSLQVRFEIAMEDEHDFMEYLCFWASATDMRRHAITDISTPTLEGGVCRFETLTHKKKYRIYLRNLEQTRGFQEALLEIKENMRDGAQPPLEVDAAQEVVQSRPVHDIQPLGSQLSAPEIETNNTLIDINTLNEENTAFGSLMETKIAALVSALREVVSLSNKHGGLSKHSALIANIAMRQFQDQDHNDWENPFQCKETVLGLIARMSSCSGDKNGGETAHQSRHGRPDSMRGFDSRVFSAKDMEERRQDARVPLHGMSQDPDVQKHVYRPGADLKISMSPSVPRKNIATSVPNVTRMTERLAAMTINPGLPDAKAARQPEIGEKLNGQSKGVTDSQSVTTVNETSPSKTCSQEAAGFLGSNSLLSDHIPMSPEMPQMNKVGKKLTDSM